MNTIIRDNFPRHFVPIAAIVFMVVLFPVSAQETQIPFDVTGSVNWGRGELYAQASFDLAQAGLKLPSGRYMGEVILNDSYPQLLRPYLLSLQVDSNSTIGDFIDRRELSLEEVDNISRDAVKTAPSFSADLLRMIGRYTVSMEKLSALLSRHNGKAEPARPLIPVETADYTGIIIIADGQLPVHGRNTSALAEPCIFPKIWDTDMNLVYEQDMTDPLRKEGTLIVRYASQDSIFRPTPSGLDGDLAALLGPNPLRILARELFGISPTDMVIDRADSLKIVSTENNRRLLREGRVLLVLNAAQLTKENM